MQHYRDKKMKPSFRRRGVLQPTTRGFLLLGVLIFWVFLSHFFLENEDVVDGNYQSWKGAILLMRKNPDLFSTLFTECPRLFEMLSTV